MVVSDDDAYHFRVFMRENLQLTNAYSIGLIRITEENGEIVLCRYNGRHGQHRNQIEKEIIESEHIHMYNQEYVANGYRADGYAIRAHTYTHFKQAVFVFFKDMHIVNYADFFPELVVYEQ